MVEFGETGSAEKKDIEKTIDLLRQAKITHQNYREFVERVNSKSEIIEHQVSSTLTRFVRAKKDLDAKLKNPKLSEMRESGYVPNDVNDLQETCSFELEEMMSWNTFRLELLEILNSKLVGIVGSVRAMDIERDVLKSQREIQKDSMTFLKEYMMQKQNQLDEKLNTMRDGINVKFSAIETKLSDNQLSMFNKSIAYFARNMEKFADSVFQKAEIKVEIEKPPEIKEEEFEIKTEPIIEKIIEEPKYTIKQETEQTQEEGVYKCTHEGCGEKFDDEKSLNGHLAFEHQVKEEENTKMEELDKKLEQTNEKLAELDENINDPDLE